MSRPLDTALKTTTLKTTVRKTRYDLAWSVQIGAFNQVSSARHHLDKLTGALPGLLKRAKISIDTVSGNDSITYRARLHGMNERQAHDLCRRIKNAKFDCLTIAPAEAALAAAKLHG